MEQKINCPMVLYTAPDGTTQLDVKLENETVWLSVEQMATLFGRDRTVISRHIRNIYKEGELEENLVSAKFAHTKVYGRRDGYTQTKDVVYYNLDVIISVGYRVKSVNGTRFRQWANGILKQYLMKGYAIDQRRLDHYNELKDVVKLMSRAISLQDKVTEEEFGGLFNVIGDYVYALDTLDRYDYQELSVEKTTKDEPFHATYDNAMEAINGLKKSLEVPPSLPTRRTIHSRAASVRFTKLLVVRSSTLLSKRKQQCSSISWSKIILSAMAISVSPPCSSSGSSPRTASSMPPMVTSASPTTPSSPLPS